MLYYICGYDTDLSVWIIVNKIPYRFAKQSHRIGDFWLQKNLHWRLVCSSRQIQYNKNRLQVQAILFVFPVILCIF